jgi:hypothetical protein
MWFATALSTNFGQTGFVPVEEFLIISRIYVIYPIPNHTAWMAFHGGNMA